ncbi:hypothetical protein DSO57_1029049 [Entomophthora muscae]|uniref:Uncharacterized protein n=1 Tax=Entomophthora muscae TaxID=34485 RepID=A0ACC2T276_9FUNG|nr:hypothetical protein DSO57_1029049 [Entomophthora muscae]
MGTLIEKLGCFYLSKYSKLEGYQCHVAGWVIRVVEFAVTSLATLGIALLPVLVFYVEKWRPIHGFLFLWGACEVWFYIYQEKTLHTLEERELGYWDSGKRAKAIEKLLEHLGDPADSATQLLSNWNKRKVKSQPCMAHFVKVLVWMLFDKPVEALTIEEARESQRILQMFKVKLAIPSINQGERIAAPSCIRPTLEPVKYVRKSFMFYLVSFTLKF